MARPRLANRPVHYKVTLCLRPGEDNDLLAYLAAAQAAGTPLAQAVIVAMRGGVVATAVGEAGGDDDIDDLLDMVF